ncbi:MAG: bifunctional enoyl-CoA hydratase/phosphate acetyltransferase [Gammaproteobacteria bacterium]
MEYLENRTFEEIQVGDTASLTRTLTEKDIQVFAIMSGDINPAHVDAEYANSDMFHKIIGHGMWGGALISTVLGTQLPGPGTIYVGQTLRFKRPVAIGDTLTVSVTATEKKPEKNRINFACECKNQEGDVVMEGQAEIVAPTKKIRRLKMEMPQISLRRPNSLFDKYIVQAKEFGPLTAGVIFPVHPKIIQAVHEATKAGMIKPMLIGPEGQIKQAAKEAEIDISSYEMIDIENSHIAITKAIELARDDKIGIILRGGATKDDLLRALSRHEKGLMLDHHMSYALVLDVPTYRKPLILSDTLINIDPSLDTKRIITQNAINFSKALGVELPKVAILAGVDTVSNAMRSTVDASALCKMADRGQLQGGVLDGPLTFDNVISAEVAKAKGIQSPVIGDADVIIVPNVETGNILSKQLEYLAESRNAGLVLGAKVPVLMSHINDIQLSTVSCAFAILQNEFRKKQSDKIF